MVTRIPVVLFLALSMAFATVAQPSAKAPKTTAQVDDIFSGTVTGAAPGSLAVVRKVPAHADENRTFILDKDTQIEGTLRANARVTVRFKADSDGVQHALRVIVRADAKTNAGSGKSERAGSTK